MPRHTFPHLEKTLARPRATVGIVALACLLAVPALWTGLMLDDYLIQAGVQGIAGIEEARGPLDLFNYYQPEDIARLKEQGGLPWWSLEQSRWAFWRPVASLTHWVDFTLWPEHPVLMHLHSLVWLALLVLVVSRLHRRLVGAPWVAGLASLLYALDDARAIPAGWIANRNALIAGVFGLAALGLHHRWRDRGSRFAGLAAPVFLLLGLWSNEMAVAVCAYLLAYAMFLDRGRPVWRALTLVPYALVVVSWRIVYKALGYGIWGSDVYVDPLTEPLGFAAAVFYRLPILLTGQWALPPSDVFVLPTISGAAIGLLWTLAAVIVIAMVWLLWPFLRKDPTSRFWFVSMVLCLVPACAAGSTDRLLTFAGVGAAALLAELLAAVREGSYGPGGGRGGRLVPLFFYGLIVIHFVAAPILLVTGPQVLHNLWSGYRQAVLDAPLPDAAGKTMVVVNARHLGLLVAPLRAMHGRPVPDRIRSLGAMKAVAVPLEVRRVDERTLVVRPEGGFPVPGARDPELRLAVPDRVELAGMTVKILERDREHLPLEAEFVFDVPLEDGSLVWFQVREGLFEPFSPPRIGETVVLDRN